MLLAGYGFNGYRIVRVLRQGRSGMTYLAQDEKLQRLVLLREFAPEPLIIHDGRRVSLRSDELRPTFERLRRRFIDHAALAAQVDHPGILKVLSIFEANGTEYLALSYPPGDDLGHFVASLERPLTDPEVRHLLLPLMDAVAALHAQGLVHGEIEPANIVVHAENLYPILIGFGTARDSDLPPARFSPSDSAESGEELSEDITTAIDRRDRRADIHALAVIGYRLITGTPPDQIPAGLDQNNPVPASLIGRGRYGSDLLRTIDRGLGFDPQDRPETVAAWRASLAVMLETAAPVPPPAPVQSAPSPSPPAPPAAVQPPTPAPVAPEEAPVLMTLVPPPPVEDRSETTLVMMTATAPRPQIPVDAVAEPRPGEQAEPAMEARSRPSPLDEITAATQRLTTRAGTGLADVIGRVGEARQRLKERVAPVGGSVGTAVGGLFDRVPAARRWQYIGAGIAALVILFAAVYRWSQGPWETARAVGTVAAYQQYLKERPDGSHAGQARLLIEKMQADERQHRRDLDAQVENLAWDAIRDQQSSRAFVEFLARFPNGAYAVEAAAHRDRLLVAETTRVAEDKAWQRVRTTRNPRTVEEFLKQYPSGAHAAEATALRDRLSTGTPVAEAPVAAPLAPTVSAGPLAVVEVPMPRATQAAPPQLPTPGLAPAPVPAPAPAPAEARSAEIPWKFILYDRTSRNEDLKPILRDILAKIDVKVRFEPEVTGTFNFKFDKVPVRSAFNRIIKEKGLSFSYNESNKTVTIAKQP